MTTVLQVVHTEPYYSRKDDVPERPREFAGNVFRISHKDNLGVGGPGRRGVDFSRQESMVVVIGDLTREVVGPSRPNRDRTVGMKVS